MAEPTQKSHAVRVLLDGITNRTGAITSDMCVASPIGCGRPAREFTDELSRREYRILGLCQSCQDSVFGDDESWIRSAGDE